MSPAEARFVLATPRGDVTSVWARPRGAVATLAVAPGSGSGLDHPFMRGFADAMNGFGIATLRFNFLYREHGRSAPDRESVLREVWVAAFAEATRRAGGLPVFVGGKSMGGRIASLCVADGMPAAGLVFLGYPLHPPRDPDSVRDSHLYGIGVRMLFLQGTRDPFARSERLDLVISKLGPAATVVRIEGGDHSFRVKGGSRDEAGVGASLAPAAATFIREHI